MLLWIPGASGLLGRELMRQTMGFSIGCSHQELDIGNREAVLAFVRNNPHITHIVNCAAFSQVDLAESKREEAYLANAIGPENLGIAAQEIGARLLHISTDYVFEGNLFRPLTENDTARPLNYYGKTKWEGEARLREVFPSACILRVSWIFGRGGKNFVAKLLQLLQEEKELRLTADQWGRPTYAPDLAQVILKLLDSSGLYHFANEGAATKYEFGLAMKEEAEKLGLPISAQSILPVPGSTFPSVCKRPPFSVFDTSKIEKEWQIVPRPWRLTLKEFLEEYALSSSPR